MGSIVEVDCTTGNVTVRDMTTEETSTHQQLQAAAAQARQAHDEQEDARHATLVQLADKLDVPIDELRAVLHGGPAVVSTP